MTRPVEKVQPPYPPARTAWLGVALLFLVYASSFVDRQIISLLVKPIRADLGISDTQIGLLQGFAFALFYALLGGPIGRLVDRGSRRLVLFCGIGAWSLFTCACGLANSFSALFAARLGVGVGEATVAPATYSLLADYFRPEKRGLPMAVFGAGVYVGMGLALLLGATLISALSAAGPVAMGWLGVMKPWQLAFVIAGAPGLLLCLGVFLLWDPRSLSSGKGTAGQSSVPILTHWRANWRAIAGHHAAIALMAVALYALLAWAPEYFRRIHGADVGTISMAIGLVVMVAGTAGVVTAGVASDRLRAAGVMHGRLTVAALAAFTACPAIILFALAPGQDAALAWLGVAVFCLSSLTTCGPAGVQELNPPELRGAGTALFQFVVTLVGLGVGPSLVPLVSDHVLGNETRLDLAIMGTLPAAVLLSSCLSLATRAAYDCALGGLESHDPEAMVIPADGLVQNPA